MINIDTLLFTIENGIIANQHVKRIKENQVIIESLKLREDCEHAELMITYKKQPYNIKIHCQRNIPVVKNFMIRLLESDIQELESEILKLAGNKVEGAI